MAEEKLVRLSNVEYYLRQTAKNMLDEAERTEGLTVEESVRVGVCAFALRELADNAHRMPAADAVEVVRCKDCKSRGDAYACPFRQMVHTEGRGYHYVDMTTDAGYCSFGMRKEAGT